MVDGNQVLILICKEKKPSGVRWSSAAIVNFQFENNILFEKRHLNVFQNFKTPFISK